MNTTLTGVASNTKLRIGLGVGLTFTAGAGVGYFIGKRRGFNEAMTHIDERIKFHMGPEQLVIDFEADPETDYSVYDTSTKAEDSSTEPDEDVDVTWLALEEAEEIIAAEAALADNQKTERELPEGVVRIKNFLEGRELTWDYDHEVALRDDNEIYVIHEDEFNQQEFENFDQSSWTWYSGDDIMVNDTEDVVLGYVNYVGDARKMPFGYGSHSKDTIHIRNTKLELEVAIQRHEGHYAVDVLGYDPGVIYVPYDPDDPEATTEDD